jgi:hypothetical protein
MRSQILHLPVTDLKPAPSRLHTTLTVSQNDKKRFSATGVEPFAQRLPHSPLRGRPATSFFAHDPATARDGGSAEIAGAAFLPTARDGGSAEREAVSE